MRNMPQLADSNQRFLFEHADVRGELAQVSGAFTQIMSVHQYPPAVARLLGEFLSAAVLLASNFKFDGSLILQARSERQLPLLMVECRSDLTVRGIARGATTATAQTFTELLGGGTLTITVEPRDGERYQGIVTLGEDSLAQSLESYFASSQQLTSRVWLACDGRHAAGMLLQQLPAQRQADADARALNWEHLCTLAATLRNEELLTLAPGTLIQRLYHQETLRLFTPVPVQFGCGCSRARIERALVALGVDELNSILDEQGEIAADCEFCQQRYTFGADDLGALIGQEDRQRILH
jgi:molecular chaperone Hsp33